MSTIEQMTQERGSAGWRDVVSRALPWVSWGFLSLVMRFSSPLRLGIGPTAERTLYFKLPIEGVRFHWHFLDPDAFFAGELTLRIINKDRDETLVVFRDGEMFDGWRMIGDGGPDGAIYFGFETDDRVRTSPSDSLIITLTAVQDLGGRGRYQEGTLPAGTWTMTGIFSSLYGGRWNPVDLLLLHGRPPVAYMECWDDVWPIVVTRAYGARGAQPTENGVMRLMSRMLPERGVDGRRCGSHILVARPTQ